MSRGGEYLLLKWGSIKGWNVEGNEEALAALQRYVDLGMSASAMSQHDTPEHKQALCDVIDAVDGPITNDWTGDAMTKEEAKAYVMEYGGVR